MAIEVEVAGSQKRKANRSKPVPVSDAMCRLDLMLKALESEIRGAIWAKATLEVGNTIVMADYHGQTFDGANCYNVLRNSTQTALILSLCKLFERPRGRQGKSEVTAFNRSDLASIPVFLHLLRQKRCRAKLVERASTGWDGNSLGMSKMWEGDCMAALHRCDDTARRLTSPLGRRAAAALGVFRDDHVAHLYAEPRVWNANRYNELFLLLDIASDLVSHACIAFRGCNLDFKEREEIWMGEAHAFWKPALAAATAADPYSI
ncbi:hypothetical protein EOA22_31780 [Mesorhizobium sp. M7A.F.Ca.US.014.04.1.1]|uniref:AbiU2 domain-containing protein n=3 Tax=Phyllobacteriaceae TaxID=69277 RepID=UPI0007A95334|nr:MULTISPECIES: hypothetical protein [Mesorhizobium]AMX97879.1 hypothetical protein A4R28_32330 [Mesorhizobium ciceri]MDF3233846.1 hypothetical protein [Mesorhizobium sp. DSM 30133]RUU16361.1 hypothetical protein EOC84_29155 [Mesorhizobium sp. Primo-B]RUU34520.1 hypothetical protein EOC83_29020 [Mesorhizobium sp. Primo-A]RUX49142.1 hypothetical protein EOA22_31780 [Mesorhizobium sp. M7A.F.Ca.US.014.04.1.1]